MLLECIVLHRHTLENELGFTMQLVLWQSEIPIRKP
jgi:hypothetical protein